MTNSRKKSPADYRYRCKTVVCKKVLNYNLSGPGKKLFFPGPKVNILVRSIIAEREPHHYRTNSSGAKKNLETFRVERK